MAIHNTQRNVGLPRMDKTRADDDVGIVINRDKCFTWIHLFVNVEHDRRGQLVALKDGPLPKRLIISVGSVKDHASNRFTISSHHLADMKTTHRLISLLVSLGRASSFSKCSTEHAQL